MKRGWILIFEFENSIFSNFSRQCFLSFCLVSSVLSFLCYLMLFIFLLSKSCPFFSSLCPFILSSFLQLLPSFFGLLVSDLSFHLFLLPCNLNFIFSQFLWCFLHPFLSYDLTSWLRFLSSSLPFLCCASLPSVPFLLCCVLPFALVSYLHSFCPFFPTSLYPLFLL